MPERQPALFRPRSSLLPLVLALALAGCAGDIEEPPAADAAAETAADATSDGPLRPPDNVCAAATYMSLGCQQVADAGPDAGDQDGGGKDSGDNKDGGGLTCITVAGTTVGAQNSFELPTGGCGLGTTASGPDLFYKIYVGSTPGGVIEFKSDFKSVLYFLEASCSGGCKMGFRTSKLKTSLPASGDYIVVVDGETAADKGSFALYLYQPGG